MGKKGRRTRWRTLPIADERSDSEESNTTTSGCQIDQHQMQQPKSYYSSRLSYSSQSTPTRRYDGNKSTRSSSTASENKITFNEDEYTRITTPRQDVLFKKGYLNKPKNYQTQTSTGNSTTSTGNGTPDHQSTDMEYESQFIFPNGFVDQNGIYYVNSFEPYPIMVFNPPTYYPEFSNVNSKTKRYSTGSLTESTTSPNNEETTSQEFNAEKDDQQKLDDASLPLTTIESHRTKKRRKKRMEISSSTTPSSSSSAEEVFSEEEQIDEEMADEEEEEEEEKKTYDLKPDAEEFIPRSYYGPPTPIDVQFIKMPPNFVPIPILNHGGTPDFNAFIPTGIPINFLPPMPQNYVNFVGYNTGQQPEEIPPPPVEEKHEAAIVEEIDNEIVTKPEQIDIAKIVTKLEEEAAKEETVLTNNKKKKKFKKVIDISKPEEEIKRNYSETLKKTVIKTVSSPIKTNELRKSIKKEEVLSIKRKEPIKIVKKSVLPTTSNEWISVSRKKRKNKEEFRDEEEEDEEIISNEVDVVVVVEEEVKIEPIVEVKEEISSVPSVTIEDEEKKPKKKTKKNPSKSPAMNKTNIVEVELMPEENVQKAKKKKKKSKVILTAQNDDYDFHLDESLEEKTNLEVSQELDRLIQRGMYNNLEEKMKTLNISSSNDNFFKTIINNISTNSRETTNCMAPVPFKNLSDIDFLVDSTTPNEADERSGTDIELYPITKAVTEWMHQTKERQPDVEIFKSPSTIFNEFYQDSSDDDDEVIVPPKHGNLPYRAICCNVM